MSGGPARLVVKFGGSALASGAGLAVAARRLVETPAEWKLAVVSAPKGMTDRLVELVDGVDPPVPPAVRSELVAFGERVSARLLTAALRGLGVPVRCLEPEDPGWPIVTRGGQVDAEIDVEGTRARCRESLRPELDRSIVVVCGFLGRQGDHVTTLRRGGSDTTALALANFLDATDVVLVKDAPGIATADPRTVPGARGLPRLEVDALRELARNGARVVAEEALAFHDARVRFRVVPFGAPLLEGEGTEVVPAPTAPGASPAPAGIAAGSVTVVLGDRGRGLRALADVVAGPGWLGLSATPRALTLYLRADEIEGTVRSLHDSGAFASIASRAGLRLEAPNGESTAPGAPDRVPVLPVVAGERAPGTPLARHGGSPVARPARLPPEGR